MRRVVETSGATCDTCGKPYVDGDALYSLATKIDDNGRMISFRHATCDVPFEQMLDDVRKAIKDIRRHL